METNQQSDTPQQVDKVPFWHIHRRMYDWVLAWAHTPYGALALFILSFAESSFFPIPPDVLLAPLSLGDRKRWWVFATNCSIASILGGIAGYCIGYFLWWQGQGQDFTAFAQFFFKYIPKFNEASFMEMKNVYETWSFWIVFTAGFTPIPYKIITITAGAFMINFPMFVIASAVGRAARFFLVAGLFGIFGHKIEPFVNKYFNLLSLLFVILLVGGFVIVKYLL